MRVKACIGGGSPRSLACKEIRAFLPTLFDDAAVSMAVVLPDGSILMPNRAFCEFVGYSEEELLDLSIFDLTFPEDRELTAAKLRQGSEGNCSFQYEKRYLRKDGTIVWGLVSGSWVLDDSGTAYGVGLIQNITTRKQSEIALRESERRFRGIFENAAAGMNTITPQGRFLQVNRAMCQFFGYSEEELLKMTLEEVTHPDDLDLTRRSIGKSLSAPPFSWHYEKRYRHKDGSTLWGQVCGVWQLDESGLPTYGIGMVQDVTVRRRSEERLEYLTSYDMLTDLPNRHMVESVLQRAVERARRERHRIALLVMDIDQFKTINESFGHSTGDKVLVAVVQRLRGRVRGGDPFGRLAGDQFGLVMEKLQDNADAELLARDLQSVLEAPFVLENGQQIYVRTSIGISLYPQDGASAHDLLRGADAAVNLAKERGGNQFCYCTAELNTQARLRLELQTELRQALDREEFVLHYQPKVDLRSGRIVGAEALLRWNLPGKGMVQPLQFIPQAEKNGLIVPIGAWVIEEACRQIREWREAGLKDVCVAINVSARQFRSGNLEDLVAGALQRHGIEPRCLTLELTESMVMNDPEEAIDRIAGLRRLGVQLSLDDFGTGYSSLGYLGRFRIDQLKIDRSFVTDIVTDPNAATIATSVIALAHRMRLKVVAEGVETGAQLGYLRQNGCDEMQGFYFSRPVGAEDFATLLRQGKSLTIVEEAPEARTLLIVDDEPGILSALVRVLLDEEYRVLTAGSAREGLELLAQNTVQVVITDQRMPEMCGTEFLSRVKALHPHTVRLVLSGYADLPTVTESVNEGALYKFLAKPWDDDNLREQIRDAFAHYETFIRPRRALPGGF